MPTALEENFDHVVNSATTEVDFNQRSLEVEFVLALAST
jgi:hypothetical protein